MLHDPLAQQSGRCVERDGVDPPLRRELGQGDGDADAQIVGEPWRRLVAGGGEEGDVEVAVRAVRAASA